MPIRLSSFFKQTPFFRRGGGGPSSVAVEQVLATFQKLYQAALRPGSAYGHDVSPREYRYIEVGVEAALQQLGILEIDKWGAMLYETDPDKLQTLKQATKALLDTKEMQAPSLSRLKGLLSDLLVRVEGRLR